MTINSNKTTAACSGDMAEGLTNIERVRLALALVDAGYPWEIEIEYVEDLLSAYDALRAQASAPRSASAGGDQAHYLSAIRRRLEQLYDASPDNPRLREQLSDELDWVDVQIEEGKLSAPPPIRIDQDAGIRERLIAAGCTSPDGSYVHASTESVLAAISANTTAVREAPESCPHCFDRTDCSNVDICKAVEEVYREPANTTAGVDSARLDFLERAAKRSYTGVSFDWIPSVDGERSGYRFMRHHYLGGAKDSIRSAIDAEIASNPLEGKGIQSITEQASSGLRSTKQREG